MANLVDKSGDAYSNVVRQASGTSLTFPMPGNVPLDVESVVATIDNTAGAATTPTLVVRDSSGEVIATKRMDDTIPAGGTGTATFSLRNSASGGGLKYNKLNSGGWLEVTTTAEGGSIGSGVAFLVNKGDFAVFVDPVTGDTLRLSAGFLFFDANGGIFRFTNSSLFDVVADETTVDSPDGISLASHGNSVGVQGTEVNVTLHHVGDTLTVFDHLNHPIFRVDETGDLHGKTGKALVFDL